VGRHQLPQGSSTYSLTLLTVLLVVYVRQVAALFASWTATGEPVSAAHYRAAMLACCDGGQVNDALKLMAAMKTAGAAPDDEMYNELVT